MPPTNNSATRNNVVNLHVVREQVEATHEISENQLTIYDTAEFRRAEQTWSPEIQKIINNQATKNTQSNLLTRKASVGEAEEVHPPAGRRRKLREFTSWFKGRADWRDPKITYQELRDNEIEKRVETLRSSLPLEEVRQEVEPELELARNGLAEAIVRRRINILTKRGGELTAGQRRDGTIKNTQKLRNKNAQFKYEVAIGVMIKLLEREMAVSLGAEADPDTLTEQQRLKVSEMMFGAINGSINDGELIKLRAEIRDRTLLKSRLYELEGDTVRLKVSQGAFATVSNSFRNTQKTVSETWHAWSQEDSLKGRAKQAAVLGALGVASGASLGLVTVLGGAFGSAAMGTALGSRVIKTGGAMHLNKEASIIQAKYEAGRDVERLLARRVALHKSAGQNLSEADFRSRMEEYKDILHRFSGQAIEEGRSNRRKVTLAAAAIGGTALASALGIELQSQIKGSRAAPVDSNGPSVPADLRLTPGPRLPIMANDPPGHSAKAKELVHKAASKPFTNVKGRFVSEIYEDKKGVRRGFARMLRDARQAMHQGYIEKVVPDKTDPDHFWYRTTRKAAEKFAHVKAGSSNTADVMRVFGYRVRS